MVSKDMPIIEVLRTQPAARDIFLKHGMGCIGCLGSTRETVETAARMHGIDVDGLIRELNRLSAING